MKKLLSIFILSFIAFSSTAFAQDPMYFEAEPFYPIEPDLGELEIEFIPLEGIPFEPLEPFPFDEPEDPYWDDPNISISLEAEILEQGQVALKWTKYNGYDFLWYKIMHSQVYDAPYYPIDPELDYFEDVNRTGYMHEDIPFGDNYYRICVITTDDRRGCSNTEDVYFDPAAPMFEPEPEPTEPDRPRDDAKPELTDQQIEKLKSQNTNGRSFEFGKWIWNNLAIILTIIAILIAASGFTFAAKRKQKSISKYMNQIDDTYSEYKMKAKRCEAELYRLKDIVDNELKSGKIDDSAYHLLMHRIEGYMVDVQKQIVNEKFGGLPASLKEEMFKMMEDGEITETEFETMQKLIKRSQLSVSEQDSLLQQIKDFKKQDEVMKKRGGKS
ncbi:hypothetical protein ACFLZH_02525 [Patescibacteria group bacterium]